MTLLIKSEEKLFSFGTNVVKQHPLLSENETPTVLPDKRQILSTKALSKDHRKPYSFGSLREHIFGTDSPHENWQITCWNNDTLTVRASDWINFYANPILKINPVLLDWIMMVYIDMNHRDCAIRRGKITQTIAEQVIRTGEQRGWSFSQGGMYMTPISDPTNKNYGIIMFEVQDCKVEYACFTSCQLLSKDLVIARLKQIFVDFPDDCVVNATETGYYNASLISECYPRLQVLFALLAIQALQDSRGNFEKAKLTFMKSIRRGRERVQLFRLIEQMADNIYLGDFPFKRFFNSSLSEKDHDSSKYLIAWDQIVWITPIEKLLFQNPIKDEDRRSSADEPATPLPEAQSPNTRGQLEEPNIASEPPVQESSSLPKNLPKLIPVQRYHLKRDFKYMRQYLDQPGYYTVKLGRNPLLPLIHTTGMPGRSVVNTQQRLPQCDKCVFHDNVWTRIPLLTATLNGSVAAANLYRLTERMKVGINDFAVDYTIFPMHDDGVYPAIQNVPRLVSIVQHRYVFDRLPPTYPKQLFAGDQKIPVNPFEHMQCANAESYLKVIHEVCRCAIRRAEIELNLEINLRMNSDEVFENLEVMKHIICVFKLPQFPYWYQFNPVYMLKHPGVSSSDMIRALSKTNRLFDLALLGVNQ